jgi:1-aminocyclopropane-1-carboxylate deaminase/D-cysteine desulfhydrase-like pyridoxal-dependent ACC family enzyme
MSDKAQRKASRKAILAKKLKEQEMLEHPEWCYCEEILHKEADIDINEPIGCTEPIDGFPRWNSSGFTQNIYRCKRCGKQYVIPMAFAATAEGFVEFVETELEIQEQARKELITKLLAAVNNVVHNGRIGTANYISIPEKNLQHIADGLGVTLEEAAEILQEYFKPKLN